jgi:hypothetical protein
MFDTLGIQTSPSAFSPITKSSKGVLFLNACPISIVASCFLTCSSCSSNCYGVLPIQNCQPTAVCASVCYSCQGTQYFQASVVKTLAIQRLIDRDPEHVARKMVDEAEGRNIRIAGSGEILPSHKTLLDCITSLNGKWWGFTRRIDTHVILPQLMFSIDSSSSQKTMEYVLNEVPVDRRAYLRRPGDSETPMPVAVTFPVHGSVTRYAESVPVHSTDCPYDRGEMSGCWRCERCY